MDNNELNEANPNILPASQGREDQEEQEQESKDHAILRESQPLINSGLLSDDLESKENVSNIFNQNQIDDGKLSLFQIYFFNCLYAFPLNPTWVEDTCD